MPATVFAHTANLRCGFGTTSYNHDGIAGVRPTLPLQYSTPSGRFRIHYAVTGADAVLDTLEPTNGVPAYVLECAAALEHAWRTEVDTLGFLPPQPDGLAGGSPALDIYIRDLSTSGLGGNSLYGGTYADEVLQQAPVERRAAWLEIDNNFASSDKSASGSQSFNTFGFEGLRVTCAHELHHAIQISSYGYFLIQPMIYELTSTWMELRVFPELQDWTLYFKELLLEPSTYPFGRTDGSNGYVWGWYGNVLERTQHGMMLKIWENIAVGHKPFTALMKACEFYGTTLESLFCTNLLEMYYTGSRGKESAVLPYADSLPELYLHYDKPVQAPSAIVGGQIAPFGVAAHRFAVPIDAAAQTFKSVVLVLSNPDTTSFTSDETARPVPYSIILSNKPHQGQSIPIAGTEWCFNVTPPSLCYQVKGTAISVLGSPYPQPFLLQEHTNLYVPIAGGAVSEQVLMRLCTSNMVTLSVQEQFITLDADRSVAEFEMPQSLAPGVYIIVIEHRSTTTLHKLLVKR